MPFLAVFCPFGHFHPKSVANFGNFFLPKLVIFGPLSESSTMANHFQKIQAIHVTCDTFLGSQSALFLTIFWNSQPFQPFDFVTLTLF